MAIPISSALTVDIDRCDKSTGNSAKVQLSSIRNR